MTNASEKMNYLYFLHYLLLLFYILSLKKKPINLQGIQMKCDVIFLIHEPFLSPSGMTEAFSASLNMPYSYTLPW